MTGLPALLEQVRGCELCTEHLPLGPRPVVQLSDTARILIAGQAPGARVHKTGIPFDDASGVRLREWLGMTPDEFYDPNKVAIVPMGFCYPGTGKSGDFAPRPECAPAWRESLLAHLTHLELTVVIGAYAQRYHLPELSRQSVTEVVRGWRAHWPGMLPLPHPSPRNNIWLRKNPWFEREVIPTLQAAVRSALEPRIP